MFNDKGNLLAHIGELEGKVHAATQQIITETGNKEFKGMKMRAIWQLIDAVIIPILTYGAEGWDLTKTEKDKIQIIVNKAIKTVLFLPQGTPTTILLAETGYLPIEHVIKRKRIMQAHRVENMKGNPLIKRLTQNSTSLWKTETNKALDEYGITNTNMSKNSLKNQANKQIQAKVKEEISKEAQSKSKIKQWMDLKDDLTPGNRPKYMNELNRKQCNIIVKTRGNMLPLKANQKNQHQDLVYAASASKNKKTNNMCWRNAQSE